MAIVIEHGYINPKFLWYWLQKEYKKNREKGADSGPQALNCQRVRELGFIVPSIEEQNEIVNILERLLGNEEQVVSAIEDVIEQVADIKKSILAKVFRGELGTNNPEEEPPQQTVFIMVCEEPEKLLDTIRSRVQRIDLKRIADSDIEEALVNRRLIDADTAKRIARIANGSWLKALEQMEANSENAEMLEWFKNLMRLAYMRNVKGMKAWSETIAATGREKQLRAITYFSRMIRENFMYNFQLPQLNYMSQEEEDFAKNFAKFVNEANVIEISELFQKARREIAQNGNAKIIFFDVALQMIVLLIRK